MPQFTFVRGAMKNIFRLLYTLAALLAVISAPLPVDSATSAPSSSQSPSAQGVAVAKDSIVLLYPTGTSPCDKPADSLRFLGTGFLIEVSSPKGSKQSPLLVTNKHVVDKQKSIIMRATTSKGCACREIALQSEGPGATLYLAKQPVVNLVAIRVPQIADVKPYVVDYSSFLNESALKTLPVTEGENIFAADMFMPGGGATENYALIRSGKIALLRNDRWSQNELGSGQAYLVQLGTTFGATGIPVFLTGNNRLLGVSKAVAFAPAPASVAVAEVRIEDGISVPKTVEAKGSAVVPNGLVMVEPAQNLKMLLESVPF